MFTDYGREIHVKIGSYVRPDGWTYGAHLVDSEWNMAQFYLPTNSNGPVKSLAVNVTITGRTLRRKDDNDCIRVKIEFVGDGEPSTFTKGWLKVDDGNSHIHNRHPSFRS